ncbi:MAG: molecular chaperone SurA [Gammaproteobacteria bacterium]|nr:molecular chaperone SurA [Gammaproteobacteria bacterium]
MNMTRLGKTRLAWNKRQRELATVAFGPCEVGVAGPEANPAHSEAKCRAGFGALPWSTSATRETAWPIVEATLVVARACASWVGGTGQARPLRLAPCTTAPWPQAWAVASAMIVFVAGVSVAAAERGTLDSIVAIVNDDVVLKSEYDDRLAEWMVRLNESERNDPQIVSTVRSQVLEQLIAESIQLQEAELRGIEVDDETLTRAVTGFARENNMTLEEFIADVAAQGSSYRALRERIRHDIIIDRVQRAVVNRRVFIAERDIDELLASPFFEEAISDEYRLGHILLEVTAEMTAAEIEAVRAKADGLAADLRAGADFAATATEHSGAPTAANGGDLGWRKESRIPSRFAEDVVDLEIGAVADPVQDSSGFHIVKMIDRRGASQQRVEQTLVRHILLSPSAIRSDEQTRAAIEAIRGRIVAGEDFAELAQEYSEDPGTRLAGGDLGWTTTENLDPAFQRMMNLTGVDELSEPFESSFGWHILEVQGRRQQDISEESRRNYAAQRLLEKRFSERLDEWLTEIRDEAFVERRANVSGQQGDSAAPFGG